MRIEIIEVNYKEDPDFLTLSECGFLIGDVVDVPDGCNGRNISIRVIRETEFVSIGNTVSIRDNEYKVIEE